MDVFRKEYSELDQEQKELIAEVKDKAQALYDALAKVDAPAVGRELALAKTNLEQSVMWAVKGISTSKE